MTSILQLGQEISRRCESWVNPNAAVDTSVITALMQAARTGDTDIVKLLLNKGANVNARAGQMGITALMNAAAFGDVEMVRLLIDKGEDINTKDTEGLTALSQAKVAKKEDIGKPKVQTKRARGNSPLTIRSSINR